MLALSLIYELYKVMCVTAILQVEPNQDSIPLTKTTDEESKKEQGPAQIFILLSLRTGPVT